MDEQLLVTPVLIEPKKKRQFTERIRTQQRIRRVKALVKEAPSVCEPPDIKQRRCKATNSQGNRCGRFAIKGGRVCATHGGSAPQVKKAAAKRLLAMVEPALVELQELVLQNGHLPSKLGAIRTVLERAGDVAIGALKQQVVDRDMRPQIVIGIKVGGVERPQVLIGMQPKQIADIADSEDSEEGELVGDAETV